MRCRRSGLIFATWLIIGGTVFDAPATPIKAPPTQPAPEERLDAAITAFDRGISFRRNAPDAAMTAFKEAAEHFEALRAAGIQSAALEYNLGNTYYRLGDLGRAILHYRRAARLDPGDRRIRENLDFARSRVEPYIPPLQTSVLQRRLLVWHYDTTPRFRAWVAASASLIGWGLLTVWLYRRRPWLAAVGSVGVVIAVANAASIWVTLDDWRTRPSAVVVDHSPTLRYGRGDQADPVLQSPLGPGTEVRIVNERAGYAEVVLPNRETGWLPLDALREV